MKAVFFDLDGTLHDHERAERSGAVRLRNRYIGQCPHSEEDFVRIWYELSERYFHPSPETEDVVRSRRERVREAFGDQSLSDREADRRYRIFFRGYEEGGKLYPDVAECLDRLHLPLGIISNGDYVSRVRILEKTGIRERFSVVVTSREVGIGKPGEKIFLEACKQIGCEPGKAIYVGDSLEKDVEGSRNAGMVPVWLNRKNQDGYESVTVIQSLLDLPRVLRELSF